MILQHTKIKLFFGQIRGFDTAQFSGEPYDRINGEDRIAANGEKLRNATTTQAKLNALKEVLDSGDYDPNDIEATLGAARRGTGS